VKTPDTQRTVLAVTTRRRDEVFGDAGQKKAGVPPARRFGDRASLEHDDLCTGPRNVVRGRDTGDARADDRHIDARVLIERRVNLGRDFIEPDAGHSGTLPEAEAQRPNRLSEDGDVP